MIALPKHDVSIVLANLDTANNTFEIANLGEEEDMIITTKVDQRNVQLYTIPSEWTHGGRQELELDIIVVTELKEMTRLTGQIQLANLPKVLIQLSHTLHTPGDFMKFRILLTDELNRPLARTETPFNVTITLLHETQHTVTSWEAQLYPDEIFSDQYLFADDRDIGNWNITVTLAGQTTTKPFKVAPYTAPIHSITINPGELITQDYEQLEINVQATYTFGKPIRGTLMVSVTGGDRSIDADPLPIDGNQNVNVKVSELLEALRNEESEANLIYIQASVLTSNGITDRTYRESIAVPIYPLPYKVVLHRLVDFFPGHNATLLVEITTPTGKPYDGWKYMSDSVSIVVDFESEDNVPSVQFEQALEPDGTAILSIPTHQSTELVKVRVAFQKASFSLTLEATYNPQLSIRAVPSSNIAATTRDRLTNGSIRARETIKLAIASSHPMDGIVAVIRKHDGENIPLFINCYHRNYYDHLVHDLVRPTDVKRVYIFGRFDGTLVQTATLDREPPVSHQVDIEVTGTEVRVRTKQDVAQVGIAIYEGVLDEEHFDSIYTHSMFNGSVFPENLPGLGHIETEQKQSLGSSRLNHLLLWKEVNVKNGFAMLNFNAPPYVNHWIVSAFAFSATEGLGIGRPVQGDRQQEVEIYVHIPYWARKMETISVDVYIVNNRNHPVNFMLLELLNTANEFIFLNNSGHTDATKKLVYGRLDPYQVERAEFLIQPRKLGSITLKANAYIKGNIQIATAETILRTVPESVQRTQSIVRLFNVDKSVQRFDRLKIPIPRTAEKGSEKITLSLHQEQLQIASLPVSLLLDKLVEADPFTMAIKASLYLDVLTLGNVERIERRAAAADMVNTSAHMIEALANGDGSFTISQSHSPSSPCWDTVIAVQALTNANRHLKNKHHEDSILKSLNWLKDKQARDGHFCAGEENANDTEHVELTSHVLMSYFNMESYTWRFVTVIERAKNHLLSSIGKLTDSYQLALVGHVLQFSQQHATGTNNQAAIEERVRNILAELLSNKNQSPTGLKLWWGSPTSKRNLENTAYALIMLTSKKFLLQAAPIVNWIKDQPYRLAPQPISPDSHVALRALIEYAKRTTLLDKQYNAEVVANDRNGEIWRSELNDGSNNRVLNLPSTTRSLSLSINGTIAGAFEIVYSYMEAVTEQVQKFEIDLIRYDSSNDDYTDWRICLRFIPKGSFDKTNMVTCEISFPTGYIALDDSVDELNELQDVVTTTLKNRETQLLITFEEISVQQRCFNVTGFRRNVETRLQPGTIKVYDITDKNNFAFKQLDTKHR
ncbi:thioester-containing protein 1 allele R1-like [Anopheles nili]|uniref:thioester-containing protein 1 allele R1-like n=1 Tax=Anopheles nili TaxID=185578 RepID=UPI00237B9E45|nr:thioester-containing protein 1 allele R1-like [Anopheles nili]